MEKTSPPVMAKMGKTFRKRGKRARGDIGSTEGSLAFASEGREEKGCVNHVLGLRDCKGVQGGVRCPRGTLQRREERGRE